MTLKVTHAFIAAGCNQLPGAVAWAPDGLLAYAVGNSVAVCRLPATVTAENTLNPAGVGVFTTLHGHTARVNTVRFIIDANQRVDCIVSASADSTLRVWRRTTPDSDDRWTCSATLTEHTASVTEVAILKGDYPLVSGHLMATTASDGKICIWVVQQQNVALFQSIDIGARYATALAIERLPGSEVPILVSAGTDFRISLYVMQDNLFTRKLQLQGHSDWIRALAFVHLPAKTGASDASDELLLASASQDRYIRLWRITALSGVDAVTTEDVTTPVQSASNTDSETAMMESVLDTLRKTAVEGDSTQLSVQAFLFDADSAGKDNKQRDKYSVMSEAVLQGHDDWVYSVCWYPRKTAVDGTVEQPMQLLSASADKSAIVWSPDPATGVWLPMTRVGDIAGTALDFYGALFSADGSRILAHGYHGSFHLWAHTEMDNHAAAHWQPELCVSGHFGPVHGLDWHPDGSYFISASLDQTARLFAPWTQTSDKLSWHEIARPQVHGYDLQCVSFIDTYRYASGADEKVVRVFDAPASFVRTLSALTDQPELLHDLEDRPAAANLPPLGLSNKAIGGTGSADKNASTEQPQPEVEEEDEEEMVHGQSYAQSRLTNLDDALPARPPLDEQLQQLTLWPEIEKLYGHGFEIIAVAASNSGRYLATACKATGPEHAVVRIYDTSSWKELAGKLTGHALTITKIRFSPDDKYLLTVSRDRSWHLYERSDKHENEPYVLAAKVAKAHSRIIWDASWSPDGRFFVTASRDKTIKCWMNTGAAGSWQCIATLECSESVTALDIAPVSTSTQNSYILAAGLEDGRVCFYQAQKDNELNWTLLGQIPDHLAHASTVHRLAWRRSRAGSELPLQLASAGQDHTVRLLNVSL